MNAPDDLETLRRKLHDKRESMRAESIGHILLAAMLLAFAVPALIFIHESGL